jgi:CheY-like chemotaxis protein
MSDAERPIKVLVVDTFILEHDYRPLLEEHLGYRMHFAARVEEALNILTHERVDIIVSDSLMPGRGYGPDLLKQARENPAWAATPFILWTAYSTQQDIEKGSGAGGR